MTARAEGLAITSGIGLVILVGALVRVGLAAEPTAPDPNDPKFVSRGKTVYAEQCASCHGANLDGQPNWRHRLPNGRMPAPPHDPTGHTWHHSDNQLFDMTKLGPAALVPGYESDMPGFMDKLSDADIWAVLSYIESTWPPDIRARQQKMTERLK
jgi:mono/diheme cytochrome c family protein